MIPNMSLTVSKQSKSLLCVYGSHCQRLSLGYKDLGYLTLFSDFYQ